MNNLAYLIPSSSDSESKELSDEVLPFELESYGILISCSKFIGISEGILGSSGRAFGNCYIFGVYSEYSANGVLDSIYYKPD